MIALALFLALITLLAYLAKVCMKLSEFLFEK